MNVSTKRLRKELLQLRDNPLDGIVARPTDNILDWRYLLRGSSGTDYQGGEYYGKLKFPHNYPYAPPSILMLTPSGRFQVNMRICMSMSDFHPESWNPAWNVGLILTGLVSFMNSDEITTGGVKADSEARKEFARRSRESNQADAVYNDLFPEDPEELFAEQDRLLESCNARAKAEADRAEKQAAIKKAKQEEKRKREEEQKVVDAEAAAAEERKRERNRLKNQRKKQKQKEKRATAAATTTTGGGDNDTEGQLDAAAEALSKSGI